MTRRNDVKREVSSRIQEANNRCYELKIFLKSKAFSKNLKTMKYTLLLRPVVLCGSRALEKNRRTEASGN